MVGKSDRVSVGVSDTRKGIFKLAKEMFGDSWKEQGLRIVKVTTSEGKEEHHIITPKASQTKPQVSDVPKQRPTTILSKVATEPAAALVLPESKAYEQGMGYGVTLIRNERGESIKRLLEEKARKLVSLRKAENIDAPKYNPSYTIRGAGNTTSGISIKVGDDWQTKSENNKNVKYMQDASKKWARKERDRTGVWPEYSKKLCEYKYPSTIEFRAYGRNSGDMQSWLDTMENHALSLGMERVIYAGSFDSNYIDPTRRYKLAGV
jgi:hypothetical protein